MYRVFTHEGAHHADEVLAIALLQEVFGRVEVVRSFDPTPEEGDFVLDIGREYDASRRRFDHHQDGSLPSTNVLVLRWLVDEGHVPAGIGAMLLERLFSRVSDIDRGRERAEPWEFSAFVRSAKSFDEALRMAQGILDNMMRDCYQFMRDRERYVQLPRSGHVRMQESGDPIMGWKDWAVEEGTRFLITPNPRGGWQIISADSLQWPIPEDVRQTFRHSSGFLAVYPTKKEAITHAMRLFTL